MEIEFRYLELDHYPLLEVKWKGKGTGRVMFGQKFRPAGYVDLGPRFDGELPEVNFPEGPGVNAITLTTVTDDARVLEAYDAFAQAVIDDTFVPDEILKAD